MATRLSVFDGLSTIKNHHRATGALTVSCNPIHTLAVASFGFQSLERLTRSVACAFKWCCEAGRDQCAVHFPMKLQDAGFSFKIVSAGQYHKQNTCFEKVGQHGRHRIQTKALPWLIVVSLGVELRRTALLVLSNGCTPSPSGAVCGVRGQQGKAGVVMVPCTCTCDC